MTTDEQILQELAAADPVTGAPDADAIEADRVMRRVLGAESAGRDRGRSRAAGTRPRRRVWTVGLAVLSGLLVAAVVVVVVAVSDRGGDVPAASGRTVTLTYRLLPIPPARRVARATIVQEIVVIRRRLAGEPVHVEVQRFGSHGVRLELSGAHLTGATLARIERRATVPGLLRIYDWEADALLPDGHPVAGGLAIQNQRALTISQGNPGGGVGTAGGMTLHNALALSSRQHAGSQPAGLANRTILVRAPNQTGSAQSPDARFFVLHDAPAISNRDLTGARATTVNGQPEVMVTLTTEGAQAFQTVTEAAAHRGAAVSIGDRHLFQHVAVAFDGDLVSVPQIDFTKYPDGVTATSHPEFGIATASAPQAREIAAALRAGPLPLSLALIGRGG